MTKILNEKLLTKVDFSKGVRELTEWEEKIYRQGRTDAIDECIAKIDILEQISFGIVEVDLVKDLLKQLKEKNK